MKPILIENVTAETAVSPYRICKMGSADGQVVQSAAVTDVLTGVADALGGAAGGRMDLITVGLADIEYGGAITRGAWLTTDASGKAVAATPAAGTNNNVIGIARVSGASGDIGKVLLSPGRIQG